MNHAPSGLYVPGPPMPAPKFATERDLSRPTLGGLQSVFASGMLGQPFMPHQHLIADVSGELDETDDPRGWTFDWMPGQFWVPHYKLVVITEQRQAGKSHQAMSGVGERCFNVDGFRSWYTAQTGQDARDQFLKFEEENIRGTALEPFVNLKRGRGEEVLGFHNGSTLRPHPPTEDKLHGKQSHRNDVDEGWAFEEEHGRALMQAIGPTQLTIPTAQTFVWSAGGTAASTWLAALVARGRAGDPDICFIEFGIPDDADAEDLDVILAHHPAAGRTISKESLAGLRTTFKGDPAGWARAAGNRWTEVIGGLISDDVWKSVREPDPIPEDAPLGYGAARAADGSEVVIAAAARVDGHVVVEILDVLPTAFGAAAHVKGWATDGPVAIDMTGPSKTIGDALANDNGFPSTRLIRLNQGEMTAACANVVDALKPRAYRYRKHAALDAAVKVAGKRTVGDGGYVWARVAAGASIAALEAATLATWALDHRPASGKPEVHFAA